MKRVFLCSSAVVIAAFLVAFPGGAGPARSTAPVLEAIVLVDAAAERKAVEKRLIATVPSVQIRWRYRVVLKGMAVVLPRRAADAVRRIRGVEDVYPSVQYTAARVMSPDFIGAPVLWGPSLTTAGNGIKIGIIDDGVDPSHPYFRGRAYRAPRGFPKGQRRLTTAKIIVARAFAPRSPRWRHAKRAFDPEMSAHATHVAGIAAGNHQTATGFGRISGVAPRAYIGNYKVLTVPTVAGFGLNGNSPEIIAGIEAAVRDGMDVINLSLGQVEIEPGRDLVARAIDGAAAAGVVPVVSAGNDYSDLGNGSIASPGSAERAITVAAESVDGPTVASFSSGGPTPLSLRMKPDVTAPGVGVLSSVPRQAGLWAVFSGTSMAAPHVAGAAALLRQRHPAWTVAQLKSALVQTGSPVIGRTPVRAEAATTREGGGTVNLIKADSPLLFASPSGISFGLVRPGSSVAAPVSLGDAGGGAGTWSVTVEPQTTPVGLAVVAPSVATVPGALTVTAVAAPNAAQGEATGFVVLTRGGERRRIPYWTRVAAPTLGSHRILPLRRPGTYSGTTRGRPALVDSYRYPDDPSELGITRILRGPETVYRVHLARPAANMGVVVLGRTGRVEPRLVRAGDENRLLGALALPYVANPYLRRFGAPALVVGATSPAAGDYDVVFDSAAEAGSFRFRFWVGDTARPKLRLLTRAPRHGGRLVLSAQDRGAGVDPRSIRVSLGGRRIAAGYNARRRLIVARVPRKLSGRRTLIVEMADYQELKNQENVARILPNTARLRARITVR